jgi:hypothetical protein
MSNWNGAYPLVTGPPFRPLGTIDIRVLHENIDRLLDHLSDCRSIVELRFQTFNGQATLLHRWRNKQSLLHQLGNVLLHAGARQRGAGWSDQLARLATACCPNSVTQAPNLCNDLHRRLRNLSIFT